MSRTSREIESREHETMDEYDMDYANPLSLPYGIAKEGFSYAWVNTNIKGVHNLRVEEMTRKRWVTVPADRNINVSLDPLGRNPLSTQFNTYKDLILMERPDHYSKRETQYQNHKTENQIKSLRGVGDDHGRSAPSHSINSF